MSYSDTYTDKETAKLEKRLTKLYSRVYDEITLTAQEYFSDFQDRYDAEYQAFLDGKYTKREFDNWVEAQIGRGKRWMALRNEMAQKVTNANVVASSMINGQIPDVFMTNYNFSAYEIEKASGIAFNIYNESAVERLMVDEPELFPTTHVDIPKDIAWNKKKLTAALASGIILGKTPDQLADSFQHVTDMNRNSAVRNARTSMTGAQNLGRQKNMLDISDFAKSKGIAIQKEWVSCGDARVRDSHAHLDGVRVEIDEEFPNGLMYPADPNGAPAEVYNCRCFIKTIVNGLDVERTSNTKESYEKWMEEKRQTEIKKKKKGRDSEIRLTNEEVYADYFEYEKANLMKEYSQTGKMSAENILGEKVSKDERRHLMAEADYIQSHATNTGHKTVYRGMVVDADEIKDLKKGDIYRIDSLTSTSTDKGIASIYTNVENMDIDNAMPVMITIQQPDGIRGFMATKDTPEIILPKGQTYKVARKFTDENGVLNIELYAKKGANEALKTEKRSISKSITATDVRNATEGAQIDPETTEKIIQIMEDNGMNRMYDSVEVVNWDTNDVFKTDSSKRGNWAEHKLQINEAMIGGMKPEEVDEMFEGATNTVCNSMEEALIHEKNHAKLCDTVGFERYEAMNETEGVVGVSDTAAKDQVESMAEIGVLKERGDYANLSDEAKDLYEGIYPE